MATSGDFLVATDTNHRLRRYYEGHGYSVVGELAGPSDHAHSVAHGQWTAILYEKILNPE